MCESGCSIRVAIDLGYDDLMNSKVRNVMYACTCEEEREVKMTLMMMWTPTSCSPFTIYAH